MISEDQSFSEFLEKIQDLEIGEIRKKAEGEERAARGRYSQIRSIRERRNSGWTDYADKIKDLVFFLNTGVKPATMGDDDFRLIYPLIKRLVDKGESNKSILKSFE